jgi:hypothetical protein
MDSLEDLGLLPSFSYSQEGFDTPLSHDSQMEHSDLTFQWDDRKKRKKKKKKKKKCAVVWSFKVAEVSAPSSLGGHLLPQFP